MYYMSIKIKRIQSLESGDYNRSGGRIKAHIQVPASIGFTDPQNSHVVFRMSAYCTRNGGYSIAVPTNLGDLQGTNVISAGGAQCLIRNAKVVSNEYGELNQQTDQNVISANLDEYTQSTSAKHAKQTFTADGDYNTSLEYDNRLSSSPFLTYSRPRTVDVAVNESSVRRYTDIRVPMKHIDRYADGIRQFPNLAVGDLTYTIEFETVRDIVGNPNDLGIEDIDDMSAVASQIGSPAAPLIYIPDAYSYSGDNWDQIPFYVGEPVELTYDDGSGGKAKTHIANIESLKINNNNQLEIVLDVPAPTAGATDACTGLSLELYVDAGATFDWNIQDIYLELHCLQLTPGQIDAASKALSNIKFPWYEHRLTILQMNTGTTYSEALALPPMCAGVAVLTPPNNKLLSGTDEARHYRFFLDSNIVTNSEIQVGHITSTLGVGNARQLHNHMLQRWFGNLDKRLLKFDRPAENYLGNVELQTHFFYPLVTPVVDRSMLMNINVRTNGSNMSGKQVFYLTVHPRVLSFKNGKLQKN